MSLSQLYSPEDVIALTEEWGFLPFFANCIPGFSIEERCPPSLWFSEQPGPWEWKGPAARSGRCVYGKLFANKAGFVSREWLPDLVNCRRDGYDFDARYDDGLARRQDKTVYDVLTAYGSLLSKALKREAGYGKGGSKGFDGVITRLQMQTYVTIDDFEYMRDRHGDPYGWGVARYTTPEEQFGYDYVTSAYSREPAESRARIAEHLARLLPNAGEQNILRIVG